MSKGEYPQFVKKLGLDFIHQDLSVMMSRSVKFMFKELKGGQRYHLGKIELLCKKGWVVKFNPMQFGPM